MRFKSSIRNVNLFIKITASLSLLGKVAWIRLDNDHIRFTVLPDQGTQDSLFDDDFTIQSAAASNTINLEVPLTALHRALKSAQNASSASIRLTKKDDTPLLSLTLAIPTPLTSSTRGSRNLNSHSSHAAPSTHTHTHLHPSQSQDLSSDPIAVSFAASGPRETTITQDIPIRVLPAAAVAGIHEPRTPEPEVHILLPPLLGLKSVSERFTKLALSSTQRTTGMLSAASGPKLELKANMHGEFKLGLRTEAGRVETAWSGLANPELDPENVEGGEEGVSGHPSTRMKSLRGEEAWVGVRVEARDWGRVLGVGRVGGRVVACFCDQKALILYVYLPNEDVGAEESVLTYYITSYAA
ncbi:MAG: hypothetical protein MMC23_000253 [Stictis urceolatum]|nr:hypothetical protein [Stictis urceolata]